MNNIIAIFGSGYIGRAVLNICNKLQQDGLLSVDETQMLLFDKNGGVVENTSIVVVDLEKYTVDAIATLLLNNEVTHVVNTLPFILNKKLAEAALLARCHYLDFTEDDQTSTEIKRLYEGSGLTCATKCGLAPGFINYVGADLVKKLEKVETLTIAVGALPRHVSYTQTQPAHSYNLSWSIDGLVNEYIKPCRIRKNGVVLDVPALGDLTTVILDGVKYEAAYTSGGVGSLLEDLPDIPNISYKTIRYPGHFRYVRSVVQESLGDFERVKKEFLDKFSYSDNDMVVVYAEAIGTDFAGRNKKTSYSARFFGKRGLSAIQATTAAAGVAVLELILHGTISGIISHADINLSTFARTSTFKEYYVYL